MSCLLVVLALPCRYLGSKDAETAMLIVAAPMAWSYLLFFCRCGYLVDSKIKLLFQSLSLNGCTSGFHPQAQWLLVKRGNIILNYSNNTVFPNFRGFEAIGPFVDMIYKMCAGDMSRFFIIYVIYLLGLAQGKYRIAHWNFVELACFVACLLNVDGDTRIASFFFSLRKMIIGRWPMTKCRPIKVDDSV